MERIEGAINRTFGVVKSNIIITTTLVYIIIGSAIDIITCDLFKDLINKEYKSFTWVYYIDVVECLAKLIYITIAGIISGSVLKHNNKKDKDSDVVV